jgi:hypothetical protein
VPGVTVAVHDAPENILERITFYDIDSRRIERHLTGGGAEPLPEGDQGGHLLFQAVL